MIKTVEDRLAMDTLIFGKNITNNVWMDTWSKRLWGSWQVLNGNAGIIIYRADPKKMCKSK